SKAVVAITVRLMLHILSIIGRQLSVCSKGQLSSFFCMKIGGWSLDFPSIISHALLKNVFGKWTVSSVQ
ncbi:MAG: hypothetical protein IKE34_07760, partial [Paenibacillus sp.]|nr:hypothetical protein [Paenibacillus sp.]